MMISCHRQLAVVFTLLLCSWGHESAKWKEEQFREELAKRMNIYHKVYLQRNIVRNYVQQRRGETGEQQELRELPAASNEDVVAEKVYVPDDLLEYKYVDTLNALREKPDQVLQPVVVGRSVSEISEKNNSSTETTRVFDPFVVRQAVEPKTYELPGDNDAIGVAIFTDTLQRGISNRIFASNRMFTKRRLTSGPKTNKAYSNGPVFDPLSKREEQMKDNFKENADLLLGVAVGIDSLKGRPAERSLNTHDIGKKRADSFGADADDSFDFGLVKGTNPDEILVDRYFEAKGYPLNPIEALTLAPFVGRSLREQENDDEMPLDQLLSIGVAVGVPPADESKVDKLLPRETNAKRLQLDRPYNGLKPILRFPLPPIPIMSRREIPTIDDKITEAHEKDAVHEEYKTLMGLGIGEYHHNWHLLPKQLTNKLIEKYEHSDQEILLTKAISHVGNSDMFLKSFWPFKYEIVQMNQRIALYGVTDEVYEDHLKSRLYGSLYDMYSLPIPFSEDRVVLSFNDHKIAELLLKSRLLNVSAEHIDKRQYVYSSAQINSIANKINDAMELIRETAPELYHAINQLIACITVYKSDRADRISGSSSSLPGVIHITPIPEEFEWSVPFYAEQIVHEFIHNMLYLEEFVIGTYNSHKILSKAKVFSSIRGVPRNFDLSLHAAYVSTGLVVFHSRAGYEARAVHYAGPLAQAVQGLVDTDSEYRVLTAAGEAMLQTLVDFVNLMNIGRVGH